MNPATDFMTARVGPAPAKLLSRDGKRIRQQATAITFPLWIDAEIFEALRGILRAAFQKANRQQQVKAMIEESEHAVFYQLTP